MNHATGPIGVFDSGLGGLSVVRELRAALPHESILYLADQAYCPYGARTADEIAVRAAALTDALVARGAKLIVVACNTATAAALPELRRRSTAPIVGLEPAVKPAVRLSRTRRVAVLATRHTATSDRLAGLIGRYAGKARVESIPAPELVELVEAGNTAGRQVERTLKRLLDPALDRGADVVVLGCTHFPFLRGPIERVAGPSVRVVDSGAAVARRTRTLLDDHGLRADGAGIGALTMMTTGDARTAGVVAAGLLGSSLPVASVSL